MSAEEFDHVADLIPAGLMPVYAIRFVAFIMDDGSVGHDFSIEGDPNIRTLIGDIEILKLEIWEEGSVEFKEKFFGGDEER